MFKTRYLVIVAFILLSAFSGSGQNFTLSGKVTGKAASAVKELQIYVGTGQKKIPLEKETMTFNVDFKLEKAQFVEVKTGGNKSNFIFMVPGGKAFLNIEKRTLNETIIQIEEGDIRRINEVMDRFYGTFVENGLGIMANNWVEELFTQPEVVDLAIKSGKKMIEENADFFQSVAPGFKHDFEFFAENFRKYCLVDSYSLEELHSILKEISASEMPSSVLTVPFYREFLVDLTLAYAARKLERYDLVLEFLKNGYISQTIAAEAIVEFIPNQSVINYLFYDKLSRELAGSGIKHIRYVDYLFAHSEESVTKSFIERYNTLKANTVGEVQNERMAAIDFEFQDTEGKVYRLADFKGKMLMIDFWASWCAPCKVQMPYFKELEKHYEGKDIVFAKVSLDNTKEAWLKGVESESLTGVVLHAPGAFKNPFPLHYGITSIPRFMLIDAEGKVISDNMPKPQNKQEVMKMVDTDLYRSEMRQIVSKHLEALGADKLMGDFLYRAAATQSLMGIEIDHEMYYQYPRNIRQDMVPRYNATFAMMLGEEFYQPKYVLMQEDSISGNIPGFGKIKENWTNKFPGWEIFLMEKVEKIPLDFDEENFTNNSEFYVVKANLKDRTEKYYIDKKDYLIKKMIVTSLIDPRKGGGKLDAPTKYEDYKRVEGVMVPHAYTLNNIVNFKITNATIEPLNGRKFSELGKEAK